MLYFYPLCLILKDNRNHDIYNAPPIPQSPVHDIVIGGGAKHWGGGGRQKLSLDPGCAAMPLGAWTWPDFC